MSETPQKITKPDYEEAIPLAYNPEQQKMYLGNPQTGVGIWETLLAAGEHIQLSKSAPSITEYVGTTPIPLEGQVAEVVVLIRPQGGPEPLSASYPDHAVLNEDIRRKALGRLVGVTLTDGARNAEVALDGLEGNPRLTDVAMTPGQTKAAAKASVILSTKDQAVAAVCPPPRVTADGNTQRALTFMGVFTDPNTREASINAFDDETMAAIVRGSLTPVLCVIHDRETVTIADGQSILPPSLRSQRYLDRQGSMLVVTGTKPAMPSADTTEYIASVAGQLTTMLRLEIEDTPEPAEEPSIGDTSEETVMLQTEDEPTDSDDSGIQSDPYDLPLSEPAPSRPPIAETPPNAAPGSPEYNGFEVEEPPVESTIVPEIINRSSPQESGQKPRRVNLRVTSLRPNKPRGGEQ